MDITTLMFWGFVVVQTLAGGEVALHPFIASSPAICEQARQNILNNPPAPKDEVKIEEVGPCQEAMFLFPRMGPPEPEEVPGSRL